MSEWIAALSLTWYASWLPFAWLCLGVAVFILAPLAFWEKANSAATGGMIFASYVIGFTAWLLGAGLTFATFGWIGLFVGLLLFGVGVVPVGAVGAFFKLDQGGLALSLIGIAVIALGLRFAAILLRERVRR